MVAVHTGHETVFSVLGEAARKRSAWSLGAQLVLSATAAGAILIAAPHWWSLAFLGGWSAAYAGWGLLVRVAESRQARSLNAVLVTIAALGTALAIAGIVGVGLAIYSGNGRGAKDACGSSSTNERCQAFANPTPVSGSLRLPAGNPR